MTTVKLRKCTFDKAIKVQPNVRDVHYRLGYPGYAFTVSTHPGREFVVCRESAAYKADPARYTVLNSWLVCDLGTGIGLGRRFVGRTRGDAVDKAVAALLTHLTPQAVVDHIELMLERRSTLIIANGR